MSGGASFGAVLLVAPFSAGSMKLAARLYQDSLWHGTGAISASMTPACKSIVYLPEGKSNDITQIPLSALHVVLCRLALTCSQSANHAASSLGLVPMQWQLFHSDIDVAACSCHKQLVATGGAAWNLWGIAWHPSPGSSHIYAIMNGQGSLFLMNGSAHQQLAQWTWQELSGSQHPARLSVSMARLVRLQRSPDGTQLAVLALGHTALLSFGHGTCP